ncbi:MAG: hypothetical protein K2H46_05940 [Muribaculaceae bacterium]|nr:hypothetical protein [Muribaculaceae bacterium]
MEKMTSMNTPLISAGRALRRSLLPISLLLPASLGAQLHEQINVEGKYVPEVIKAEKINAFPKPVELSLASTPLSYEGQGVAAAFSPALMPLPATSWRASRLINNKPGYLELGTGSWLNSTLSAGYRAVDTPSTVFGVRLQHNSTSLWQPRMSDATEDVKQWRYDDAVGLYASHIFGKAGRLDAAIDYHIGVFNYYGWFNAAASGNEKLDAPTQTLNDLSVRVDWHSLQQPEPALAYAISGRVRHFAFRSLPLPAAWNLPQAKGNRETDLELTASVRMPWDNGSSIGIDGKVNILLYGGPEKVAYIPAHGLISSFTIPRPNKYAVGTLTPYYRFTRGLLDVKLGADIDIAVRAGESGNRYSLFHFAPEIRFAVQTGTVGIFLNALGGTTLNTLAALHEYDYYMMPALISTRPTYTPLDATFGVNLGPFSGFSVGVYGAFRASRNLPLGGWYSAWTDYGNYPLPSMTQPNLERANTLYSLDKNGINLSGFSVGGRLQYSPAAIFSLKGDIAYQPQGAKRGYFNGYDRARITAKAQATVSPLSPLHITLGYDYRGVRNIYTRSVLELPSVSINGSGKDMITGMRLPDLCLLNLSAAWDFSPNFSVWIEGDNLLNRHDDLLPLQPMQGMVLTGGIKLLF